ncbi:MAG: four helix bundle protein [Bacteroidota bacterium]
MKDNNSSAKKFDLEERLISFAVEVAKIIELFPNSKAGNHLGSQLIRSGTSPALNYGEAQSAESRKDFIHKMKTILKELRESRIGLTIVKRLSLLDSKDQMNSIMDEANQLISIFVKSIDTAKKNTMNT